MNSGSLLPPAASQDIGPILETDWSSWDGTSPHYVSYHGVATESKAYIERPKLDKRPRSFFLPGRSRGPSSRQTAAMRPGSAPVYRHLDLVFLVAQIRQRLVSSNRLTSRRLRESLSWS